jgi:inner membrane protein
MKYPVFLKILSLGLVGILLAVFLFQIQHVISERQDYRDQAVQSVSESVAGAQTLIGPFVAVHCTESWPAQVKDEQGTRSVTKQLERVFTVMPSTLHTSANVQVEPRSRSIYSAQVLGTKALLKAQFLLGNPPKPSALNDNARLQCGQPTLMLALGDPRGIRNVKLRVNETEHIFKAGTVHPEYPRGMQWVLPATLAAGGGASMAVEIDLEYVGTQQLGFVPVAETNTVQLSSNWPHPSFGGHFAPAQRSIKVNQGFEASWRLTSMATHAAEQVSQGLRLCQGMDSRRNECLESIQVSFVDPVDFYALSDRASKYGLLFVALTFVGLGLLEVLKQLRVHPVQYLLAGAALCTFFLLLVSLSEHVGFAKAYACGALATVLLLSYYARFMLGSWRLSLPFGFGMALLYTLLYVLLQLEQTALAVGSVAVFAVLAGVMVSTRNINWYHMLAGKPAQSPIQATSPQPSASGSSPL